MDTLAPGDFIDHFKIDQVLHSGAMGQVYRAVDMLSDQTVSIKRSFGDILTHPLLYYHFQNEERIGKRLDHPRIVSFLDQVRSGQYLVLEYIPGKDLRGVFSVNRKLSLETARRFVLQIAEGLDYMHGRDVIHLDIKPENIMVTPDDELKIIDFGLARIKNATDLLAEDFMEPQGTPFYIAPEQLLGCRDDLRSDIYSLGMVFYEMLTGQLPFKRSTRLAKVRARLKFDPVPPRYYDPALAPQIQEIILKSLAKDPAKRYQTVTDLIEDLTDYTKVALSKRSWEHRKYPRWQNVFTKVSVSQDTGEMRADSQPIPQILGAIINHESADPVVETVKRQAILRGCDVTLLTVIDEDPDLDMTTYQAKVDGERFRLRIDGYIRRLRNYNLDPVVRIKKGVAADEIVRLAKTIRADLIVLGTPRKKWLKKLFGGSTIDKVIKKAPCNVVVAESPAAAIPFFADISEMTSDQIFDIDLFLLDSWVYHLNWLSDLTYSLLRYPHRHLDLNEHHCLLGKWIDQLADNDRWKFVLTSIIKPHKIFHEVSHHMVESARSGNINEMKRIYFNQALPLSTSIRQGLQTVSTALREQVAYQEAGVSSFVEPGAEASEKRIPPSGRTKEKIKRIKDYFWRYPDGSPETCLLTLNQGNGPENGDATVPEKE